MSLPDRILKFFWPSCKLTPWEVIQTALMAITVFAAGTLLCVILLINIPSFQEEIESCKAKGGMWIHQYGGPNLCIDQKAIVKPK